MQEMYAVVDDIVRRLEIPDPDEFVLPGVSWGVFDELLTPAYWCGQAWQHEQLGTYNRLRFGTTLREELAACLLGGFGMKAELGVAAFSRLLDRGLLEGFANESILEAALSEAFVVQGRVRRYRYPRQKARYLAGCICRLSNFVEPKDDLEFRDSLAEFPGVGLKTASWIVRNHRGSNRVAVIDVHILRAGQHIGLFQAHLDAQRNYRTLENAFIGFAAALNTSASLLDALMWDHMRRLLSSISPSLIFGDRLSHHR
jgi:thermostable 8-oxoguanine DNA glycosylase